MPRNMSFMLTTQAIIDRRKTVTRRLGWKFLKPGEIVNAVEKCQGLKKGEKVQRICQLRIVSVKRETLRGVTQRECEREGFPSMSPADFRDFFIKAHKGCDMATQITRIQFEYVEVKDGSGN